MVNFAPQKTAMLVAILDEILRVLRIARKVDGKALHIFVSCVILCVVNETLANNKGNNNDSEYHHFYCTSWQHRSNILQCSSLVDHHWHCCYYCSNSDWTLAAKEENAVTFLKKVTKKHKARKSLLKQLHNFESYVILCVVNEMLVTRSNR